MYPCSKNHPDNGAIGEQIEEPLLLYCCCGKRYANNKNPLASNGFDGLLYGIAFPEFLELVMIPSTTFSSYQYGLSPAIRPSVAKQQAITAHFGGIFSVDETKEKPPEKPEEQKTAKSKDNKKVSGFTKAMRAVAKVPVRLLSYLAVWNIGKGIKRAKAYHNTVIAPMDKKKKNKMMLIQGLFAAGDIAIAIFTVGFGLIPMLLFPEYMAMSEYTGRFLEGYQAPVLNKFTRWLERNDEKSTDNDKPSK